MVDVVALLRGPLAHASDAPARIEFHGGGQGANTAAWLARAGTSPALTCRVGDDSRGREAIEQLHDVGVDVHQAVDPELPTGTCVILVSPDGERTMVPDAGANDGLSEDDLSPDPFRPGGHVHVAGYSLLREGSRAAARAAIVLAGEREMTVSVDPSSAALLTPAFLGDAAGADLLLPNADEATALTGERDPARAASRLCERFAEVVVTLGADGALWSDGRSELRAAAEAVARPEDSTGAGDAFAAGLIAARLEGAEPAEALAAGCRLAAAAVATRGARPA